MSRSTRRALVAAVAILAAVPGPAAAHAIGGTFELPVPLWLYLAGAAAAVAASFVVLAVTRHEALSASSGEPTFVPAGIAWGTRLVLRVLGLVWWYGAIAAGILVGDISPLPAVLLWIGIWVGLPIIAVVVGNPWPSLSPFRTTFAALEWLTRRLGAERLDLGLAYPAGLARWPAVVLLGLAVWAELVLPSGSVAGTVAVLMLAYTVTTLVGMTLFGQVAWLRNAELFEVLLGWFGRIGPIGRRSVDHALCTGCGEGCDPDRCIDCPECAATADDRERRPILRPWVSGLAGTDFGRPHVSDAAFIILALAGVTYDGMRETALGAGLFNAVYPLTASLLGEFSAATFLAAETLQLVLVAVVFFGAFAAVVAAGRALVGTGTPRALGADLGRYAPTLLPIAGGYLIAHYFTLVLQGLVWLPSLIADPLLSLAPQLDAIPVAVVWYLSVAAIVAGHVAGIVLAHRLARQDAAERAATVGLPMVGLMIGYTVLSLWIVAAPIVVEPGAAPLAAFAR
ncbi:MAG: hypothetical protein K5924_07845 [Chloroflexi bacterium]|nr:hypothetical protein [Chloroflexota bacterium]